LSFLIFSFFVGKKHEIQNTARTPQAGRFRAALAAQLVRPSCFNICSALVSLDVHHRASARVFQQVRF
jgi:hypothetical protein